MVRIRAPRDFFAGLLFVGIGALGATIASGYAFGTALRMGPGFFPSMLSWCTIGFGAIIALRSFAIDGEAVTRVGWRPLILVLAAIVTFALLVTRAGLVLTVMATAFVGGMASREMGRIEALLLGIALAAFCALVFVYGLSQPFELWPL
jgi:hypothetical protein